ncbi:alpha/beta fold hydrolase [Hyphomonas sp.]|uniref:alpha/beta fold hydrolase n=1 Tax=Hyphomonas sp. TaxID=87 RepID=UPI0035295CEE
MPVFKRVFGMDQRVGPAWPASVDPVGRDVHHYQDGLTSLEYMIDGAPELRPLIVLQSLEMCSWPTEIFCRTANSAGFRVISIRRPGFGANSPLTDLDAQASLIRNFIGEMGLEDVVLVGLGCSNPICERVTLSGDSRVTFSVFSNCAFNYDQMGEFQPEWIAKALEQALTSPAGGRLSLMALKSSWGVFGQTWVFENLWRKSLGDIAFLRNNSELMSEAISMLQARLDVPTFMFELANALIDDPILSDGCFRDVPAITVSGTETTSSWKTGVEHEAERLGLPPVAYLSSGDMSVIYQSADEFFSVLTDAL